jgi:hypothetical protein
MKNCRVKPKAQAIAEMAILGSLLIVVFSTIISIGQRFDKLQEVKMRAFRKALTASYIRNAGVSYSLKEDSRGADFFTFGHGGALTSAGYASVLWQRGVPGTNEERDSGGDGITGSYAFYESNGKLLGTIQGWDSYHNVSTDSQYAEVKPSLPRQERQSFAEDETRLPDVYTAAGVYKEDNKRTSDYAWNSNRSETAASIDNNETASAQEASISNVYWRGDSRQIDYHAPGPDDHVPTYLDTDMGSDQFIAQPNVNRNIVNYDGVKRTEVQFCDPTIDPNCSSGPVTATRHWQTAQ